MTNSTPPALAVTPTMPVLAFNFEQLKAWALGVAEHYSGLIVTEDGVTEAKRDMAEINKARTAVDAARKETVRQVSEPIRTFEAQVKEVCGIFDQAYGKLAEQVKMFEDARRAEKRDVVDGMIEEEIDLLYGSDSSSRPAIPVREEWLNKTASLKSVRGAVKAEIEKILEAERRQKELEQARRDRAGAIENHVKAMNQQYGLEQPVAGFLHGWGIDLNTPLTDVLKRINEIFDYEREQRAKKAASAPPPSNNSACVSENTKSEPQAQPTRQAAPEEKIQAMSIVLEYSTANEKEVQACLATLKSLCFGFGARYRQE